MKELKMKQSVFTFFILICSITPNLCWAQLNLAGASASIANLNDNTSELNTNFIGGNAFIEFPIQTFSTRAEYSYYVPTSTDKDNLPKIDQMSIIHLYIGKVLRQGQRFQIPLYIGGGKYDSEGDINFDNWDIGAKLGARLYVSPRVAVFADFSAHYVLATDFTYTNILGVEETADLKPISTHLNIGVAISYLKSD